MKNKIGGAAIIGGIATVATTFLSLLVSQILVQIVGWFYGLEYVLLLLGMSQTFVAMFVGIKIYSMIVKMNENTRKSLIVSGLAGIVEALLLFVIPVSVSALGYVITFIVLFLFALIITNDAIFEMKTNNGSGQMYTQGNAKRCSANEKISMNAQYAYNEKFAQARESTIQIDEILEAKMFAQAVELQLLKSPASARFCSYDEMTVTFDGVRYIVSGYVDSQNSFGAYIRTPFKVTVFKDFDTWKCADKIISASASIGAQVVSHTLLYWIIGAILSLGSFAFYYFVVYSGF